jgi:hypothetical protein
MPEPSPEQIFFADPAIDRAVAMIMTLAAELWVTKDRLRGLEVLLAERGVLPDRSLDQYEPQMAERTRVDAERRAYVAELMRCVRGEQMSKGAPADLHQRFA